MIVHFNCTSNVIRITKIQDLPTKSHKKGSKYFTIKVFNVNISFKMARGNLAERS